MATFLLYESASGYALFEAKDMDWIGDTPQAVAETVKCVLSVLSFFKSPPLSPDFDWEKRRKTRPPKFSLARGQILYLSSFSAFPRACFTDDYDVFKIPIHA